MSRDAAAATISSYYEAFNRSDREGMLSLLSGSVIHEANEGGCEVGIDAFRAFLERMDRHYSEQVVDLVVFADQGGERAAAEFHIEGKYLVTDEGLPEATGQTYRLRVGAFFELNEGKIVRVTNYYNLRHWIELVTKGA